MKNKTECRQCIDSNCMKYVGRELNDMQIVPFEGGTADTQKLFSFFLHKAPNIESSHSRSIPDIIKQNEIFELMMQDRHFVYHRFCWFNAVIDKELQKGYLNGERVCLKCKRYVCKKKKTSKKESQESDLDCFLRHIRNAIAHGRVFFYHAGNKVHIVFEDKNTSGNISARIVCIKADLEHWKKVLSNPNNYL